MPLNGRIIVDFICMKLLLIIELFFEINFFILILLNFKKISLNLNTP